MKRISPAFIGLALCIATSVSASEAILYYQNLGNIVGYANGGAGFAFVPSLPLSVTSLGFGGSDLTRFDYQVTLWNSSGMQLASTTVTTGSPFLNQTHYGAISPVTLSAGQTYYLGAAGLSSGIWFGDAMILPPDPDADGTISVSPDISYLTGALGMGINGGIPLSTIGPSFYINANFQYTVVPEPSLVCFGSVCLAGLVLARRRTGRA